MNNKSLIITVLFIFLCVTHAFAQTTIKAQVDKLDITTDEVITYKLSIATSAKKIPPAQLPKFSGFDIISQSQSSEVSLSKGNLKTVITYIFILSPQESGKLNIEAGSIKIENNTLSSETFQIQVKPGKAKTPAEPEQKPVLPQESPCEAEKITL